jgi:ankyrin repeat protein
MKPKKVLIIGAISAGILLFAALLYLLVQSPTELLLKKASASGESSSLYAVALTYLKVIRKLDGLERKPGHATILMVLSGCNLREEACVKTTDWLLSQGEDINAKVSLSHYEMTALHSAVLQCDENAVQYLLSKGANPNEIITGGKFQQLTALKLLSQVPSCPMSSVIADALRSHNGHD